MAGEIAPIESALIQGDLSKLTPDQRLAYYKSVCDSLGLNPLTKPFAYIELNRRLVLYALKDCTDQLRTKRGVSITRLERDVTEGVYVVTAYARTAEGREDSSIGAVPIEGLKGEARANALMKAETKAKRRVTLSICGLGILDETEVEPAGGRFVPADPPPRPPAKQLPPPAAGQTLQQEAMAGDVPDAPPARGPGRITPRQMQDVADLGNELEADARRINATAKSINPKAQNPGDLTEAEADQMIDRLKRTLAGRLMGGLEMTYDDVRMALDLAAPDLPGLAGDELQKAVSWLRMKYTGAVPEGAGA